jgi:DNA-binding NarL/FixJ family response regulator
MNKLGVFLVDDHAIVREGLKALLNSQTDMCCIGEAADGRAAISAIQGLSPDVVVLDVSMPEMNGLKVTEQLVRRSPASKVVAFTRHSEYSYVQQLLKAGAAGYVLKQSSSAILLGAIRAVAAGQNYLDPAVTAKVVGVYTGRAAGSEPLKDATDREKEVLRLIALGYSNKEIASQISLSVKTVEIHKANAMRKLNMRGRTDIVKFALLQGWLDDKQ